MMAWLDLAWWGYMVLWGVLLIHCLLKRSFFPLIGPHWATKGFWTITFVFTNPLLTLLYVIFGVFFNAQGRPAKTLVTTLRVVGLVLILGIIGIFELPHPASEKKHMLSSGAQTGVLEAKNSMNSSTVSSTSGHARFSAKRVSIRCESSHTLIDKVCRDIQQKMATLPYIETVDYWPYGIEQTGSLGRTDVYIVIKADEISEEAFGIHRKGNADISCYVGDKPEPKYHHIGRGNTPTMNFSMNAHLEHSSVFKGFESQQWKYKQQSINIAQQFIDTITKQFDKWIKQHGLLPELPEYMYGTEATDVQFDFLKRKNATCLHRSEGLLKNSCVVWRYEDDRNNKEAFGEVRDLLKAQGWRGGNALDREGDQRLESFAMSKKNNHIQVFRKRGRNKHGGILYGDQETSEDKLPIIVEYVSLFSKTQIDGALRQLFASDVNIETKLLFENTSYDEQVKQLLLDSVKSQRVKTMQGYLLLGRHHAGQKDMDQAADALMLAKAMSRTLREHNPATNEFKSLAKQIGDESLSSAEVGIEYFQRAEFIDMSTVDAGTEFERALGEPLMFYQHPTSLEKEDEETNIKTVVIRISSTTTTDNDNPHQVETIAKATNQSSVRTRGLSENILVHTPVIQEGYFRLKIKALEGDIFKLTVIK